MTETVDAVVARLQTVAALRTVEGAAELVRLMDAGIQPHETPAAFVIPQAETAADTDPAADGYMTAESVSVLVVVAVAGDRTGDAGLDALAPVREAVMAALDRHLVDAQPLAFLRRQLASFGGGMMAEQIDFTRPRIREIAAL